MKLHLPSVLASVGVVALFALLTSQSGPLVASGFRIEYMPHPRDMIQISQPTSYTVPQGKIFVLTGLGGRDSAGTYEFVVNGVGKVAAASENDLGSGGMGNAASVKFVPPGMTAPAGSVITVGGGAGIAVGTAWGYLANQ